MSDPFFITGPALISFSGGRTSAYMLWRILQAHGGTLPDDVIVAFGGRIDVPHGSIPDGIECRDETIRLLDERVFTLTAKLAECEAREREFRVDVETVGRILSAMDHEIDGVERFWAPSKRGSNAQRMWSSLLNRIKGASEILSDALNQDTKAGA